MYHGTLFTHKKEWNIDTCYKVNEPQNIISERSQTPIITIWFHWWTGRSADTESWLVFARGWEEVMADQLLHRTGFHFLRGFPMAQPVKNMPAMWETWVRLLGWEDPLEKGKATHSSVLAWRIPQTIESMGSLSVKHDWMTFTHSFFKAMKIFCK